ncbi:kynureninase [Alteromonas sp. MYP5]|uniref:Kynureninase n=2 Tax=Alteromonas ponticola TaxID=2720613 RepID=A0ABX1R065_9ALTE|nr:kynureninase [Alteromonas ponticola]NMH59138.1 kynureninase [Alteromonas ponticola]
MQNTVQQLDDNDPLAHKRNAFVLPENMIYLDGNSLGALTRRSSERVQEVVRQQWGQDLIGGWNLHDWINLPQLTGEKIAPLLGAKSGQVIVCDSISVNLFKLLTTALSMQPGRVRVLSEQGNFPTDLYMVQGVQTLLGEQRCELRSVASEQLEQEFTEDVAVLLLTHVNFRSGHIHDMQRLTRLAHEKGILVIWDLAHSAGAVPLTLDLCKVDFAVGCGYKYLNGGPGAPAFIYAAEKHHSAVQQPLSGWMGHANPFAFTEDYQPALGIKQFLTGTPSILALAALDAALDVFADVDMHQLRDKSITMTEVFLALKDQHAELSELQLISPMDSQCRGSQLSFSHPQAYAICQALITKGVVPDFRAPDIIRFGFAPLYLSFANIQQAIEVLCSIMQEQSFLQSRFQQKRAVT